MNLNDSCDILERNSMSFLPIEIWIWQKNLLKNEYQM